MLFLEKIKEKIKSFSLDEQPREACGFVFEKNNEIDVFPCKNFSENPNNNFSISPKDYLKAGRLGKIIAVYHSHTDGTKDFSSYDLINSLGHSLIFVLYNVTEDSFSIFDPKKEKTYICNEPFKMGVSDCYNFVVNYYNNLNITLEDPESSRKENWYEVKPNLIEEIVETNLNTKENWLKVDNFSQAKKHDILLFKMLPGRLGNHVGIYLGDNSMIHRPRNKSVTIEKMSKKRISKIYKIYRNEQFN